MHLPPRDLWPNAETFLKQMRDKARRGPGAGPAPTPSTSTSQMQTGNLTSTNAGRVGGVSFGGATHERPTSSGGKGGLLPNLHTNRSGDDDSADELSPLNATSGGGKKFFGTGNSTPAQPSGANNAGFGGTADANTNANANAKKGTAASSGKPPAASKERKRSAVPATTTPTTTANLQQKPGSAKRSNS